MITLVGHLSEDQAELKGSFNLMLEQQKKIHQNLKSMLEKIQPNEKENNSIFLKVNKF